MVARNNEARHSQRMAALCAVSILLGLLLILPISANFPDWLNAQNAPDDEPGRYLELTTFDMDSKTFHKTGSYRSYWVAKNSSGDTNYYNVTHSAGVISVEGNDTNGLNGIWNSTRYAANVSWSQMHPYFEIYFDYTAKTAYDDNAVRCWLKVTNLYVSANPHARTITLSAGGETFYTTTLAQTDTTTNIDVNITLDVNQLREAIIAAGNNSLFLLKITSQDTTLSIANSEMMSYNVAKLYGRDDGLIFGISIGAVIAFAGVFLVQPKYSLPLGGQRKSRGY